MELSWAGRERKLGEWQAGLLQLFKFFLSLPPLLLSSPITCPVAPSTQGCCTGDHSSLLPCYHPPMPRVELLLKTRGREFLPGSPTEKSGNHCSRELEFSFSAEFTASSSSVNLAALVPALAEPADFPGHSALPWKNPEQGYNPNTAHRANKPAKCVWGGWHFLKIC